MKFSPASTIFCGVVGIVGNMHRGEHFFKWTSIALALMILPSGCATNRQPANDPMPAFSDGAIILFQGDSITDGNRGRTLDPNHILGHGYQFIISAKYGEELAGRHLTFLNRGVSGNTVSSLARRWQKDTLDIKPDILSILIGVNDLGSGVSADRYEQEFDELLAETTNALPNVHFVLGEPFGLPVGGKKSIWDNYRKQLLERDEIVIKLGKKYHAPVVHYQKMFEDATNRAPADYWIWDGVHPTYSGHQLMADEWVRTVRAYWPERIVPVKSAADASKTAQ
jgi:lysophospholipase L1-like esterase